MPNDRRDRPLPLGLPFKFKQPPIVEPTKLTEAVQLLSIEQLEAYRDRFYAMFPKSTRKF